MTNSPDGKRWIVKFYYAPGKQTTKTLGPKTQISRRQAEMMRDELVRPLNEPIPEFGKRHVREVWQKQRGDSNRF